MTYDPNVYRTREWFESLKWQHQWIEKLAGWYVGEFGKPESIMDFGAGDGWWLKSFYDMGVRNLCAIELDSVAKEFIPECIQFVEWDLCKPGGIGGQAELVICLEVIEHLPRRNGEGLVTMLCQHSADRILFSSAGPGQQGTGHIALEPQEFWRERFEGQKFGFDANRTGKTRSAFKNILTEIFEFLPQNVQIFSRVAL